MTEYHVVIPDEVFSVKEWEQDDLPAICVVNQSLVGFEPKVVFAWHLSIIVDCEIVAHQGMPTPEERDVLDQMGDHFGAHLKADGNALFLARVTWNSTRQYLYRVYDPEPANAYLMKIIEKELNLRPFDFRMEHDPEWLQPQFYLDGSSSPSASRRE